jgi:hypothetical protein
MDNGPSGLNFALKGVKLEAKKVRSTGRQIWGL